MFEDDVGVIKREGGLRRVVALEGRMHHLRAVWFLHRLRQVARMQGVQFGIGHKRKFVSFAHLPPSSPSSLRFSASPTSMHPNDVETKDGFFLSYDCDEPDPLGCDAMKKRDSKTGIALEDLKVVGAMVDVPLAQYASKVPSSIKVNVEIVREITRTPSPTQSEADVLDRNGMFDYKSLLSWRFWAQRRFIGESLIVQLGQLS